MTHQPSKRSTAIALCLLVSTACGGPPAADAGLDAAGLDAAGLDAAGLDAEVEMDAARPDAGLDGAGLDAGPDDAGPDDAGVAACDPSTLTFATFSDAYRDGICALYARCAPYTSSRNELCHPGVFAAGLAPTQTRVDAGEIMLDPAQGCACLEALASPSCGAISGALFTCSGAFVHTTRPTTCAEGIDCDVDQRCVRAAGACPGTCEALPRLGETCDGPCELSLTCVAGRCELRREIGETCDSTHFCRPELTCEGPFAGGVCRGPASAGASCGGGAYCIDGLVCDDGTCGAGVAAGGACDGSRRCGRSLRCDAGTCVRALLPGDACALEAECPRGYACDGTCVARPIVGDPCPTGDCFLGTCVAGTCAPSVDGAPCERSLFFIGGQCEGACDPTSGLCVPRLGAGAACTGVIPCETGLECDPVSRLCGAACMP